VVDSDVEEATEAEVVAVPVEEDARMRRRSGLLLLNLAVS
jgi:hypothetical protein